MRGVRPLRDPGELAGDEHTGDQDVPGVFHRRLVGGSAVTAPAVIGLDLSLTSTGIADKHGNLTIAGGLAQLGDKRLHIIAHAVRKAATVWPAGGQGGSADPVVVDLAVIELLPQHMKSAGVTGMVHGVVRVVLMELRVPYVHVTPSSLKQYATGRGNADKGDMREALRARTGVYEKDDNKVDAWWLRAMGLDHLGHPVIGLPKSHRVALDKVEWPT